MSGRNQRKQYWVDLPFQTGFILKFVSIVIGASFLIGAVVFILTQNFTTVAIEKTKVFAKPTADFILPVLSLTVILVSCAAAGVVFWITLFVSHRIAGPIFRIKKGIQLLKSGNLKVNFMVRKKDQLKGLAETLQEMSSTLHDRHDALKKSCDALAELLRKKDFAIDPADREKAKKLVADIEANVNYFKT